MEDQRQDFEFLLYRKPEGKPYLATRLICRACTHEEAQSKALEYGKILNMKIFTSTSFIERN